MVVRVMGRRGRRCGRAVCALLVALAAVVVLAPRFAAAQGLNLEKAVEKSLEEYDRPNPHFELDCTDCHDAKPPEGTTSKTVKFKNGDKGNVDLCYSCHDPSDNVHPIHVDPTKGTPPVAVPKEYPLESRGEKAGTVVCSTCHYIHTKTAGMKLLRGFPASSHPDDLAKAKFTDRRQFCTSCHGVTLAQKSPHKGKDAEKKNCSFCHASEPKAGEPVTFTKGIVELCDFCHAATKGAHYLLVNPFADPNLSGQLASSGVPLIGGQYTCVSCHNPHGGTGEEKYLRKEFVALALKSARVRPHYMKAFCEACHTVRPKLPKGAPGAQKLAEIPLRDTDPNKLCNRCHESGLSKANAHPIRVVEQKYKDRMPADWPLYEGSLTCLTCHTAGDSPVLDPANPSFLRGAPYESRNAMCWKCHLQEEFAQLNPHEKVQELQGCEYCHEARPDIKKFEAGEKQEVRFKGDIVILCLRCHDVPPHPAGRDHVGTYDKEGALARGIEVPKEFPLDRLGRVTCSTCHNPHSRGESRSVSVGMEICANCHKQM